MIKFRDTDYLQATTRVRSLENKSLTRRELLKMVEARSADEAYKVLTDAGIGAGFDAKDYEKGLSQSLSETYAIVQQLSENKDLVRTFKLKYDGHNLKTLIKAKKTDYDIEDIATDLGNVPVKILEQELVSEKFDLLDPALAQAAKEAEEALAKSNDPQMVDIIIDKAVLETMAARSKDYDNKYLQDLIAAEVDIANIRIAVRVKRMGREASFLKRCLAEGGKIDLAGLSDAFNRGWSDLISLISASDYGKAFEGVLESVQKGSLTAFEKACDNYIIRYLTSAKLIPFGVEPLIAYLYSRENEIRAARIVMASKLAGVSAQQITERLRDTYA